MRDRPVRRRTYPSEGSVEAVQLAGFVSRSRCGIIAERCELKYRMPVCFGDEGCNRGVDGAAKYLSRGAGDLDVSLEDRSGFLCRHLPNLVCPPGPATAQLDLSGGSGVMHP